MSPGAAPVGWKKKRASPKKRATVFITGCCAALSAWRWRVSPRASVVIGGEPKPTQGLTDYYHGKLSAERGGAHREPVPLQGVACHDALMDRCGWPAIRYDGQLLVSHQDALLMGGKVQAPPGLRGSCPVSGRGSLPSSASASFASKCASGQALTPSHGDAGVRSREMRPLRRVPVELRAGKSGVPGRSRRPALRRELDHAISNRSLRKYRSRPITNT